MRTAWLIKRPYLIVGPNKAGEGANPSRTTPERGGGNLTSATGSYPLFHRKPSHWYPPE